MLTRLAPILLIVLAADSTGAMPAEVATEARLRAVVARRPRRIAGHNG